MSKMRVHEVAKELNMDNKAVLKLLSDNNIEVKTHMSSISVDDFNKVKNNKGKQSGVSKVDNTANTNKNEIKPEIKPENKEVKETVKTEAPQTPQAKTGSDRPNNNYNQNRNNGDRPNNGGYQNRNNGDRPNNGGYQNRNNGDRPNNGGYQNRTPNGDRPNNGGYQNRNNGDRPNNGGYQNRTPNGDRPNNGGYQNRTPNGDRPNNGGYQNRNNGDRPNNGGYQNRTTNGDRPNNGGYQNRNNGDRPNNGGYQNRPNNGGYQNRPNNGGYQNRNTGDRPNNTGFAPKTDKPEIIERNDKVDRTQRFNNNKNSKNTKFEGKDKDGNYKKPAGKYNPVDLSKQTGNKQNRANKRRLKEQRLLAKEVEVEIEDEDAIKLITIGASTNVNELANKTGKSMTELIMGFMKMGIMVNKNQTLDFETASNLLDTFDILAEKEEEKDLLEEAFTEEIEIEENLEKQERPPVVVVMGHVDHGKTSLLDAIKSTNVIKGEAGGITQHIGAYKVKVGEKKITFLDTPGHEAFTAMRMRGAQITDIAILVVAADDGVMPQTIEAINHAKNAGIQIIVAINKIDKPAANPDRVKQELTEHGLLVEEWGGDVVCCNVSARTNQGIDELLDLILISAEMHELKATFENKARGAVIEAYLHKGRGPVSHILVQSGTLKIGDPIVAGGAYGKVRAMTDERGKKLKVATPSTPVEILGLSEAPKAGDLFFVANSDKQARQLAESVKAKGRVDMISETPQKVSLDDLFNQIQLGNIKDLNIIIKGDVQGSVEAVRTSLEKLSNEEVRVRPIHCAVGTVTESDITLAAASNAIVIAFNVKTEIGALSLAEEQKIDVRNYQIIYKAIEDIEVAMKGMLAPVYEKEIQGYGEVRQIFKASGVGTIGGSMCTSGKITRHSKIILTREGEQIFEGELSQLKRFKDDVKEVAKGYEFGILLEGFNDLKEGDQIEAYIMVEKPRV